MNYTNNFVQIKKFSRLNSANIGSESYKSNFLNSNFKRENNLKKSSRNKKNINSSSRSKEKYNQMISKEKILNSKSVDNNKFFNEIKEEKKVTSNLTTENNIPIPKTKLKNSIYKKDNNEQINYFNKLAPLQKCLKNLENIQINDKDYNIDQSPDKIKSNEKIDYYNKNVFNNLQDNQMNIKSNDISYDKDNKNTKLSQSFSNYKDIFENSLKFSNNTSYSNMKNVKKDKINNVKNEENKKKENQLILTEMNKYKMNNKINYKKIIGMESKNNVDSEYSYFSNHMKIEANVEKSKSKDKRVSVKLKLSNENSNSKISTTIFNKSNSLERELIKLKSRKNIGKNNIQKNSNSISRKTSKDFQNSLLTEEKNQTKNKFNTGNVSNTLMNTSENKEFKNNINLNILDNENTLEISHNDEVSPYHYIKNAIKTFNNEEIINKKQNLELIKGFKENENKKVLNISINNSTNSFNKIVTSTKNISKNKNNSISSNNYEYVNTKTNTKSNSNSNNNNYNTGNGNSNSNVVENIFKNDKSDHNSNTS